MNVMAEDMLDRLSCGEELRKLDKLYAKKKQEAHQALEQGRPDCWELVREQSAIGEQMLELEKQEARKIVERLRAEFAALHTPAESAVS